MYVLCSDTRVRHSTDEQNSTSKNMNTYRGMAEISGCSLIILYYLYSSDKLTDEAIRYFQLYLFVNATADLFTVHFQYCDIH